MTLLSTLCAFALPRMYRHPRDYPLFKEEEVNNIKVIYSQTIGTLAKNSKLRQRVAATAIVYFKRFFLRNAIRDHDPRLIAPVALVSCSSLQFLALLTHDV